NRKKPRAAWARWASCGSWNGRGARACSTCTWATGSTATTRWTTSAASVRWKRSTDADGCRSRTEARGACENPRMRTFLPIIPLLAAMLSACSTPAPVAADEPRDDARLRVATYNVSLYDDQAGGLVARLQGGDAGARKVAAVLQRVRPDLVLVNEFDHDEAGRAADLFQREYLEQAQPGGGEPLHYPYRYLAP